MWGRSGFFGVGMTETIRVTKLDAARRQLLTAIELWFQDGDPIAIHTLAYAAHEIVHRLFRLKGLHDLLFDSSVVKEGQRVEWGKLLKQGANFLKHAKIENDPDVFIDFPPFANDMFIIMSLEGLRRMGLELKPTELAFLVWQSLHTTYLAPGLIKKSIPIHTLQQLRALSRREFLKIFLNGWRWG